MRQVDVCNDAIVYATMRLRMHLYRYIGIRAQRGTQLDMAVMAIPVHTAKHVTPQHSSTAHIVMSRYIRVIPWRFSVGKLRSAWDIPGSWRDLGFVGEFVARYELARTQCYSRCIASSWLSNESFRSFNGVVCYEIMSRTGGRLLGTVTWAEHWICHNFSPRPPIIHSNEPSYAKNQGEFIKIKKSRMHSQMVQI